MSAEARKDVVRYWWSKAEESLASAHRELEAGSYAFAVNRVYYAAFYGVSQEGDYVALSAFDRTYVESQLDRCTQFLSTLRLQVSFLSAE